MQKMIFCNTGWMEYYQGGPIYGGGSFVKENGYGWEIYNFKEIDGRMYGYAQAMGANNLKRLDCEVNRDDEYVKDVLVVFTATHKVGGTYIVGWYKNAVFYRDYQECWLEERKYEDEYIGFITETESRNAVLLPEDMRFTFLQIPRGVKGGMGESSIWYADSPLMKSFRNEVIECITHYEKSVKNIREKKALLRTYDIEKRKEVEKKAIDLVAREYRKRGFQVTSVEDKNYGWDLEAKFKSVCYKLEVKGLYGDKISVELSRNEYEKMRSNRELFRLCIVSRCLSTKPFLSIFSFSNERQQWLDEEGNNLVIEERVLARCYIN